MRIERIHLKNYRQFREAELVLDKEGKHDLFVIIGKNGTGKTNILNAVNWCIYGDEPHLSKKSQGVPILNESTIRDKASKGTQDVSVNVWTRADDGKLLLFKRKHSYNVYGSNRMSAAKERVFEVEISGEGGKKRVFRDEEAESYVERFVPERIREYFFFDGERLDRYFREATGQKIRHSIFDISQIDLLERIRERLENTLGELRKQAGRQNPRIEKASSDLTSTKQEIEKANTEKEERQRQLTMAQDNVDEFEERLRGIPDVESLTSERKRLMNERQKKKEILEKKRISKNDLLFEYAIKLNLIPAVENALTIINEKKQGGELPPTIDKALLETIAEKKICSICDRDLDQRSLKHVKAVLEGIRLSSKIAQLLGTMEASLVSLQDEVQLFSKRLSTINVESKDYEDELGAIETKLAKIASEISGFDEEEIRNWHEELRNYEDIQYDNQNALVLIREKLKRLESMEVMFKKVLDEELSKEEKAESLKKQIAFCSEALDIITDTKESIMLDIKNRIEDRTEELYFYLLWKKKTFKEVRIDDDYDISLIHRMGYECLGTVSAAERELLALSFTLALHEVSGFAAPLLIDTPVARVSDSHRKKFGEVLVKVSDNKQIILLFTPSEYSEEISEIMNKNSSKRYTLSLSPDETETAIERI